MPLSGGGQRLTRYEAAATVHEFIRYVDTYLMPFIVVPTPAPTPTPRPTPRPTPTPEPTPMPEMKTPLKMFDLRVGGDFRLVNGYLNSPSLLNNSAFGPSGSLDMWLPQWGGARFGLNAYGDYLFWHKPDDFSPMSSIQRLTTGGGLKLRLLGTEYADDFSLTLGAGYAMQQKYLTPKDGSAFYANTNHGPTGSLTMEWPMWSLFSLVLDDRFTWFVGNADAADRFTWRNDLFAGVNVPAFDLFTFELGYRDTRIVQADEPSVLKGDQGLGANLRFRF